MHEDTVSSLASPLSGWMAILCGHCILFFASTFVWTGGESGWSFYPLLPLRLSGWMVNQGGHCILSCLSAYPGGWLFVVFIVPPKWSGWMVNQGGHCILSCLPTCPGGW